MLGGFLNVGCEIANVRSPVFFAFCWFDSLFIE